MFPESVTRMCFSVITADTLELKRDAISTISLSLSLWLRFSHLDFIVTIGEGMYRSSFIILDFSSPKHYTSVVIYSLSYLFQTHMTNFCL